ncbi:aldo/keto reductase [Klebsiella pneumoniae]|uniref:aldo/keto reductase n=1 Tax=Klebsiella pneumoniae TaxID=573 RepID=UPI002F9635ED
MGVGRALRYTEVPREQLFITSKIRGRDMGYARTLVSFNETLERLGVEYLELFSHSLADTRKKICMWKPGKHQSSWRPAV